MKRILVVAGITATLALAACGDDDSADDGATTDTAAQAQAGGKYGGGGQAQDAAAEDQSKAKTERPGTEINVAGSQFGEVLFDGENQAIYLFDKETTSKPECYGDCAAAWPPVLTQGDPVATGAAEEQLLGTTKRDDGATQVTYAGQPLYYYAHEGPGQVLCHNVAEFGGLWLVLDAEGEALS